jgi:hypothetical protein
LADLSQALRRFAASPRYGFVKTLQVGRLVGAEGNPLGVVNELTFEKLVELGTKRIAKLGWLSRQQELLLVQVLDAFSDSESGAVVGDSAEPPPTILSSDSSGDSSGEQCFADEPVVSSVQLELDLRERLQQLQRHPHQAQLAMRQLGEFWDPGWLRAPFEESFTLGQLAHFDLANLLRKRTVSSDRLRCIVKALDRALSETPAAQPLAPTAPALPLTATAAQPRPPHGSVPLRRGPVSPTTAVTEWVHAARPVLPYHEALLEFFAQACLTAAASAHPLACSVARLPELLSARQLLPLLQGLPGDEVTYQQLQAWRSEATVAHSLQGAALILQGPAVPLMALASALFDGAFEGAAARLAAQIVVLALGASQPHVQGRACQGTFSLNPELLAALVERALEKQPRRLTKELLSKELARLCPALEAEVHQWLCEVVVAPPISRPPVRKRRMPR